MGRGGNEDGEGLFMSRNAEDSEIGLGFSREAGGASPCPWSEAGAVSGMSPGGSRSAHGINPLYLGYPEKLREDLGPTEDPPQLRAGT